MRDASQQTPAQLERVRLLREHRRIAGERLGHLARRRLLPAFCRFLAPEMPACAR